jgi:hypothetical protein
VKRMSMPFFLLFSSFTGRKGIDFDYALAIWRHPHVNVEK